MTIPLDQPPVDGGADTGTADTVEADYRTIETGSAGANSAIHKVHMQLDAVDGMARDVIEGYKALPRRGIEVGGLLLGRMDAAQAGTGEGAQVWVERFQRIACEHKFGPQFVLNREDQVRLEEAAAKIAEAGELTVIGAYRSHTRAGFQLEESDQEFVDRYFGDPSDLVLLIKPESSVELRAQFFTRDERGKLQPAGPEFPFQGRMLGVFPALEPALESSIEEDEAPTGRPGWRNAQEEEVGRGLPENPPAKHVPAALVTPEKWPAPVLPENVPKAVQDAVQEDAPHAAPEPVPSSEGFSSSPEPPRFKSPRLVPDFVPAGDSPNPRTMFRSLDSLREREEPAAPRDIHDDEAEKEGFLKQWWPLLCAVVLVLGAVAILFWPGKGGGSSAAPVAGATSPAASGVNEIFRPLGLYVDPSGQDWRITWNQTATPLANARAVGLFVREGDDQTRIDLSPEDLKSGSYQYKPKSNDVAFRLEVTDAGGKVSAESFRVMRTAAPPAKTPESTVPHAAQNPSPVQRLIAPKATHRVPPVVPAGIRPRIHGSIPIDVRVKVDAKGRVTSAVPLKKHSGLEAFLADRAVAAARQWRFTPASEDGRSVPGVQTIHFVFDR